MRRKIIPYEPHLKEYARYLRTHSTLSEILLWQKIKNQSLGVRFRRQVPMLRFIVDFYCHEIRLAIEVDGEIHKYKYDEDARRQKMLEAYNIQFLRFDNFSVKTDMENVLNQIRQKIRELKNPDV